MPTRIVLDDLPKTPQLSQRGRRSYATGSFFAADKDTGVDNERPLSSSSLSSSLPDHLTPAETTSISPPTPSQTLERRSLNVRLRSSILRELAVRSSDESATMYNNNATTATGTAEGRLTSDDIRASPRFVGYLFSMIAASVLLVSVVQFYKQDTLVQEELPEVDNDTFFITNGGALVYRWKLWGAVYAGAIGVGLSLLILVAHFDTLCVPRLWMHVFRDGSTIERNLIILLMAFWAAAIHVCTSSLSIGEQVGNVFFTTWIAFGSITLNYGVWRESAGLPSLGEEFNILRRETTYNWIWIAIFSLIFAGAATDMYRNRNDIQLRYQGEILELQEDNWKLVLAIVWTEVTVCVLAVILNESVVDTWLIPFTIKRPDGLYRYACGWRQFEGLIMLAGVGAKFWVIVEFSGVAGVVNGLSNAYFGLWGTFFNSVFGLATWLRENKNFDYIPR